MHKASCPTSAPILNNVLLAECAQILWNILTAQGDQVWSLTSKYGSDGHVSTSFWSLLDYFSKQKSMCSQGTFFRLYYPCQAQDGSVEPNWIPCREYFAGLADFMKMSRALGDRIFNYLFGEFSVQTLINISLLTLCTEKTFNWSRSTTESRVYLAAVLHCTLVIV